MQTTHQNHNPPGGMPGFPFHLIRTISPVIHNLTDPLSPHAHHPNAARKINSLSLLNDSNRNEKTAGVPHGPSGYSQHMEKLKCSYPTSCKQSYPQFHEIASYTHYAQCRLIQNFSHSYSFLYTYSDT